MAQRERLARLVAERSRKYRKEFGNTNQWLGQWAVPQAKVRLLQDFGGLPQSVEFLNCVPAEEFKLALDHFATEFGLTNEGEPLPAWVTAPRKVVSTPPVEVLW